MSKLLRTFATLIIIAVLVLPYQAQKVKVDSALYHLHTISGGISPKSVVHSGKGVFFAQNMMYRHTITVYNREYKLLKTIRDKVEPSEFGFSTIPEPIKGGPVECCFSPDGTYAWVSNYNMSGGGDEYFNKPGCDGCSSSSKYDSSFVYKINTQTLKIESIVKVGAIPKYLASTPDGKFVLVTNWTSGDLSIIDVAKNIEVKRIKLGTFPRGIVVDSKSEYAYITIMGSYEIVKLNLENYTKTEIKVGKGPRHLCISPDDKFLYITLNSENKIAKLNLLTLEMEKVRAGHQPRSMTIDASGKNLYVVNYNDANFTKYDASTLVPIAITKTKSKPIGITYDDQAQKVWVACYSGSIQIFKDSLVHSKKSYEISSTSNSSMAIEDKAKSRVTEVLEKETDQKESRSEEVIAQRYVPKFKPIQKDFSISIARFDKEREEKRILTEVINEQQRKDSIQEEEKELELIAIESEKLEFDSVQIMDEPEIVIAQRYIPQFKPIQKDFTTYMARFAEERLLAEEVLLQRRKDSILQVQKEMELLAMQKDEATKVDQKVNERIKVEGLNYINGQGEYLVVLGAFGRSKNVSKLRSKLEKNGIATLTYYNPAKQVTYVSAGQFKNEEEAESKLQTLKVDGYDCWVFKEAK